MENTEETLGKVVFNKIRWRIIERYNPRNMGHGRTKVAVATCITCQVTLEQMVVNDGVASFRCRNPQCARYDNRIEVKYATTSSLGRLVIDLWEGSNRLKEKDQWINLDQELVRTALAKVEDEEYWAETRFFNSSRGKMLVVYVGKKGHKSKVQFFIKDGDDQVSFDQVGDINPKELFMGFKAYFSDGAITETKHPQ